MSFPHLHQRVWPDEISHIRVSTSIGIITCLGNNIVALHRCSTPEKTLSQDRYPHWCSIPDKRRSISEWISLWLLKSFQPLFRSIPWSAIRDVLQIYWLVLSTTQPAVLFSCFCDGLRLLQKNMMLWWKARDAHIYRLKYKCLNEFINYIVLGKWLW